jgi:uncharacterized protein Yka (UPF0111/DUF47 family)
LASDTTQGESSGHQRELERKVEKADALLRKMVKSLSRSCPPHLVCEAAREDMLEVTPHLHEALDALAGIESRRDLTDEEQARRRAFRTLLQAAR